MATNTAKKDETVKKDEAQNDAAPAKKDETVVVIKTVTKKVKKKIPYFDPADQKQKFFDGWDRDGKVDVEIRMPKSMADSFINEKSPNFDPRFKYKK